MKSATVAGIVLIILGIFAFAYQGITFTTQKKVVDIVRSMPSRMRNTRFRLRQCSEACCW